MHPRSCSLPTWGQGLKPGFSNAKACVFPLLNKRWPLLSPDYMRKWVEGRETLWGLEKMLVAALRLGWVVVCLDGWKGLDRWRKQDRRGNWDPAWCCQGLEAGGRLGTRAKEGNPDLLFILLLLKLSMYPKPQPPVITPQACALMAGHASKVRRQWGSHATACNLIHFPGALECWLSFGSHHLISLIFEAVFRSGKWPSSPSHESAWMVREPYVLAHIVFERRQSLTWVLGILFPAFSHWFLEKNFSSVI